jgi:hypothetical protein
VHALLSLGLVAQLSAALPADSIETLRDRARSAEARFERLSRQLAPLSWGGSFGTDCDEIVGRFCLHFDSTTTRPATLGVEAARIVDARREAVEAIRRYFAAAPADRRAAGPLVRLLIRDGRAAEAASGAGAFAALSSDTLWGELLQGLAHHWAGAGIRAERHFIAALGHMPEQERREWLDPSWLLDHSERSAVRRLSDHERADYERRFWLLMDPFWLTPANERWNEHIARHVEARLLADVPTVAGMVRWGADMDQLTIRYGTPTTRARQSASMMEQAGMIEYWDTAQRAFAPARLSRGVAAQPSPGERPVLYAATARSGYALRTVDRIVELDHQATRFLRGDSVVLRVDAAMPLVADTPSSRASDSMADAARSTREPEPAAGAAATTPEPESMAGAAAVSGLTVARAGVFVYDSAFTRRSSSTGPAVPDGDTVRFALFAGAPATALVYSAEILGDSLAAAGRARYAIHTPFAESGLALSDLLITRRFAPGESADDMDDPRLRPFTSLIFLPGDTIGIYAEVYRRGRTGVLDIQVSLEDAGRPSLPGRLARWLGRTLGLIQPGEDPRVGWRGEATAARYVIALNVPLLEGRDGLYDLVVRVTDPGTGEQSETRRRIRLN